VVIPNQELDLSITSNLVITGANGFVGQSLLSQISTLPATKLPRKITLISASAKPVNIPKSLINKTEYLSRDLRISWDFEIPRAAIINLAADGGPNAYSREASESFVKIGENFSKWVVANRPIRSFHASSGAADGIKLLSPASSGLSQDQEISFRKIDFIESRIRVEKILENLNKTLENKITIGRLYSFVGPVLMKKKHYAVSEFIEKAVKYSKIDVKGDPNTLRSYLNERDMSRWILLALLKNESLPVLSIGSAKKVSIRQLADFIAMITNASVTYRQDFTQGDEYVANNRQTLEILEVLEQLDWKDSVRECIEIVRRQNDD